jgi:hypothetical protein
MNKDLKCVPYRIRVTSVKGTDPNKVVVNRELNGKTGYVLQQT